MKTQNPLLACAPVPEGTLQRHTAKSIRSQNSKKCATLVNVIFL